MEENIPLLAFEKLQIYRRCRVDTIIQTFECIIWSRFPFVFQTYHVN